MHRSGILISGYYGFGNAGDEAVLAAIVQALKARGIEEITVLSGNPSLTEQMHSVRAIPRMNPGILWNEMRKASLLLSGGGSLFQDATSVQSVVYYFGILLMARLAGLRLMVYAQGVGPLNSGIAKKLTAKGFNWAKAITVRDQGSAELLRKIGVRSDIRVVTDPVFALKPDLPQADDVLKAEDADEGPFLGVALRSWPGVEPKILVIAQSLDEIQRETGLRCVFLPMQPEQDYSLAETINREMKNPGVVLKGGYPPATAMGILGKSSLVLAMRLHALIFAAAQGVPSLGISYDPKIDELLAQLGTEPLCDVQNLSFELLKEGLFAQWADKEQISERLKGLVSDLKVSAISSADIALVLDRE